MGRGCDASVPRRYDAARAGFLALLLRKPPLRFHHFLLLNNVAWVDMMLANPELLDEADEYSQAALKAQPKCALFQGTRGYVLLRRGSVAQGIPNREAGRSMPVAGP